MLNGNYAFGLEATLASKFTTYKITVNITGALMFYVAPTVITECRKLKLYKNCFKFRKEQGNFYRN